MKNKIFFRTILIVIVLVIVMISMHFYNFLNISEISFTDDWSEDFKIGETNDDDFKLSSLEDNILNLNIEKPNKFNFNIIDKKGEVKDSGTTEISNFEYKNVNQSYLIKDKYIYLYKNNVYMSTFDGDKFLEPIKIIENVNYLTVRMLDENIIITTSNDEKVLAYKFQNEELENIFEKENDRNIKSAYYSPEDNLLISVEDKGRDRELLTLFNEKKNENIVLVDINKYTGYSIKDINIDNLEDRLVVTYLKRLNKDGSKDYQINNIRIDKDTLDFESTKYYLDNYDIYNLESDIETYVVNNEIHIIGSGENSRNQYSSDKNDIFDMTLKKNGEVKNVEFISTTDEYSNQIEIVKFNGSKYVVFNDVVYDSDDLRIFSDSEEMMAKEGITREDYLSAGLKAVVIPFISIMYTVIRGLMIIFVMALPLGIFYFTYFNKGYSKDSIKIAVMIGIYIIANIIVFKFIYFTQGNEIYYPNFFFSNFYRILGPLSMNMISGLATFIFYKESKKKGMELSFIAYPTFFIIIDVFLNNILYVPFLTIFRLFGF